MSGSGSHPFRLGEASSYTSPHNRTRSLPQRPMHFSTTTLSFLVLLTLVLVLVTFFLLVPAALRERSKLGRAGGSSRKRLEVELEDHARSIERLEAAARQLALGQREIGQIAGGAVCHVGVVRFDAFEDMGGRLSFSAALLDGNGDGLIITSINGRQDTRTYAKRVRNGTSSRNLSDEERHAIRLALSGTDEREVAEARGAQGG